MQGSTAGIVVGFLVALFGASGLGQAIQNAMNTAWAVPRNSRPNPFFTRFKSLLLLTMAGTAVLGVSVLSTLGANTEVFGSGLNRTIRLLILLATIVVVGLVLTALSRVATTRHDYVGRSWPGAFTVAVLWQGAAVRRHLVRHHGDHRQQGHERHVRPGARADRDHLPRGDHRRARHRGQRGARAQALAALADDAVHRQRRPHRRRPAYLCRAGAHERAQGLRVGLGPVRGSRRRHPRDRARAEDAAQRAPDDARAPDRAGHRDGAGRGAGADPADPDRDQPPDRSGTNR